MNSRLAVGLLGFSLLLSLCAVMMSGAAIMDLAAQRARLTTSQQAGPDDSQPARVDLAAAKAEPDRLSKLSGNTKLAGQAQLPTAALATIRLPNSPVTASKDALEAEAEREAKQLIELLPDNANALHVLAMLYAQLHKTAEAEELWVKCVKLDPKSEPYYINLAAIAIDRGDNQLAVDTLRKAIDKGIDSPDINHHLGVALNSLGESTEAAEVAKKTLAGSPNSGAHWFILGQAQQQLGQFAEAEQSLRRAVELGGNSKALYFALFNACMRLGKKDEAIDFKARYDAIKEVKLDVEERYQILSEAEARRVCVSILAEAVALYRAMGDELTAEHLLLRILALDDQNLAACEELVTTYSKRQELANEILIRQRIIELNSTDLLNYLLLAKAQVQAGQPQAAEAQIKLAISLAPQMVTGYAAMADFLLEQQQPSKAQWYVEQAIRLKPTRQGFELLAKTLSAQGKADESRAALDMAKQADSLLKGQEPK